MRLSGRARSVTAIVKLAVLLALFVAAPLYAIGLASQDGSKPKPDDDLSLKAELVVMNLSVTDRQGGYVHNLTQRHFSVREDNKPQQVAFFGTEETPFAAAVLLDVSGSMEDKMRLARTAIAQFADHLRTDDVLAIYRFADDVKQMQDFTNLKDINEDVWDVEARGATRIYDCVVESVAALSKREERRRAVLLISDGMDNQSRHSLDDATKQAIKANVAIYSIDLIGTGAVPSSNSDDLMGHAIMKAMAEKTGGQYLRSPGGNKLNEAFDKVTEELRNQYTLGYYSSNEKHDGKWRKVEISLPRPDANVHVRAGYYAPKN